MKSFNRREFLKASGAAATLAATPGLAYSQVVGGVGPFADYRALVCVFLFGGNDSFNMLVPRSDSEYNAYAASRQNLAIPQADRRVTFPVVDESPDRCEAHRGGVGRCVTHQTAGLGRAHLGVVADQREAAAGVPGRGDELVGSLGDVQAQSLTREF